METATKWYAEWFNSPYYEILYKERNDEEAQFFMSNLIKHLALKVDTDYILDVACGTGRHTSYLHSQGFTVHGIDLSERNIAKAKKLNTESKRLQFAVCDMRKTYKAGFFSVVMNLFTSFGYFENPEDNQNALTAMASNLSENGKLVLDYFNPDRVIKSLVPNEIKNVEGITFYINRKFINSAIYKSISFTAEGKDYQFVEKVSTFSIPAFRAMFEKAGLEIVDTVGDYAMNDFDGENSPRLIFIAQKK